MNSIKCFNCDEPVNFPEEATSYTCSKCDYHEDWSNDNNETIQLPEFNRIMCRF